MTRNDMLTTKYCEPKITDEILELLANLPDLHNTKFTLLANYKTGDIKLALYMRGADKWGDEYIKFMDQYDTYNFTDDVDYIYISTEDVDIVGEWDDDYDGKKGKFTFYITREMIEKEYKRKYLYELRFAILEVLDRELPIQHNILIDAIAEYKKNGGKSKHAKLYQRQAEEKNELEIYLNKMEQN